MTLVDATRAELRFKLWLYTEMNNDYVFHGASVDGVNCYGYATSGNTEGLGRQQPGPGECADAG